MVDDKEREAWNEMVERAKKGEKITREEMVERAGGIYSEEMDSLEKLRAAISHVIANYCRATADFGWGLYLFPFKDNPERSYFMGEFTDEIDLPKMLRDLADEMEAEDK